MPVPLLRTELPQTLSRLKWAAKIRVSPDLSDILGFPQSLTAAVAATGAAINRSQFSSLVQNNSQLVGAIESLEIVQTKGLVERFGFNENSQEAFQVAPVQFSKTLTMSKALIRSLGVAEKAFNFFPSNLAFQQTPFIIHVNEPGQDGANGVEHFFFNCWFADSVVKYDVTDVANVKLIQTCRIKCGRMLTLDDSDAGSPGSLLLQSVFGGILAVDSVQNVIDDLDLT